MHGTSNSQNNIIIIIIIAAYLFIHYLLRFVIFWAGISSGDVNVPRHILTTSLVKATETLAQIVFFRHV